MRLVNVTLLIVLTFCLNIWSGSYFSVSTQGIGNRIYFINTRGLGLGGAGLASPDTISLGFYTVSNWRYMDDTRANLIFAYERNSTRLTAENFATTNSNFNGLALAIPVKTHKVLLGLTVQPYTRMDFSFERQVSSSGVTYNQFVYLRGHLTRAQFNIIWSPHPRLGLALSGNYYFGLNKDRYQMQFNNSSYYDSDYQIEYRLKGPGVSLSADWQVNSWWHVAGFSDLKPDIHFTRRYVSPTSGETSEYSENGTLPMAFGLGSQIVVKKRWALLTDLFYQNWSEGFDLSNIDTKNFRDIYQLALGVERKANRHHNARTVDRLDYRAGFSVRQLGYAFNHHAVHAYGVHLGLGIPFAGDRHRLDMALVIGKQGDKDTHLAEETFLQFQVSLSMGELWYQKFR